MMSRTVTVTAPATESQWVRFDNWANTTSALWQAEPSGGANYTIQSTLDDPNDPVSPVALADMTWPTSVQAATAAAAQGSITPPVFARVLLNNATGSVKVIFVQQGSVTL